MGVLPMAVFGLEVPPGGVPIPAKSDIPAAFRLTMAAIDPSAEPEGDSKHPRATLKIIRAPLIDMDDDEDSDFDVDEMDAMLASDEDGEESSDEEANGGPSDPAKSKKARKAAAVKQLKKELAEEMEVDDAPKKGKGKVLDIKEDFEDDDEDSEEDSDEEDFEPEEFVLCTLDPSKHYQQPLDITVGEDEQVWFVVNGTHSIFLTGNYVEPDHTHDEDSDDEDEDEYDLSPDEDELDEDFSEDDLDDLEDPRITEVEDESEEEAPKLIKAADSKKGKNKRAAEETETSLDDLISKAQTNGDDKLSKKQAKKLKNNEGKPVAAETKDDAPSSDKKKVQFAKNLEQGPTGSPAATPAAKKAAEKPKNGATLGPKTVQGVTIDDKKLGSGPAAKRGDRVGMRYIGKLQKDGKVFDSNKKGKPFSFKLGTGEVIKGWDIGIAGMSVGGERRITVPAHLAYGGKSLPGIPSNSTLVFDVKCLEIK
ncbi:hypothetical protein AAFC00_001150 [Neodothiora populina]|uniref:FK506-binding protein n=1 Tax=Neodothiora populina TaxID=2781224 RepID=A0ABR3PN13_9PEZI